MLSDCLLISTHSMISSFSESILDLIVVFGLPLLALVFVLKGMIVLKPVPTSIVIPGYILAVQVDVTGAVLVAAVCAAASVSGEFVLYKIVDRRGVHAVNNVPYVNVKESRLDRAINWFNEHGGITVLVGSAISGIRGFIIIPAALTEYPVHRTMAASFVGTFSYHVVVAIVGVGVIQLL